MYFCVRYLLSRSMREDLKRSLSQCKVSLSAHLSILPKIPLLIWLVRVADSLGLLRNEVQVWKGMDCSALGPARAWLDQL